MLGYSSASVLLHILMEGVYIATNIFIRTDTIVSLFIQALSIGKPYLSIPPIKC